MDGGGKSLSLYVIKLLIHCVCHKTFGDIYKSGSDLLHLSFVDFLCIGLLHSVDYCCLYYVLCM